MKLSNIMAQLTNKYMAVVLLLCSANIGICSRTTTAAPRPYATGRPAPVCYSGHYWNQLQSNPDAVSALNLMCNASTGDSHSNSDACFGCFSRVIYQSQFQNTILNELSSCATKYLEGTVYEQCAEDLRNASEAAETANGNLMCTIQNNATCNFEKCVHKMDKEQLIRSCTQEVKDAAGDEPEDDVTAYLKITNCILTKVRCKSVLNNGNGMYMRPGNMRRSWNMNRPNALFVTSNNELRVTTLQPSMGSMMCGFGPNNIQQASWQETC